MKFLIANDVWEVIEGQDETETIYFILKNGETFCTACGNEFETASGACYAILNEYSVD